MIYFMANDFSLLYAQFREILDTGTEEQAQKFLTDHMGEFPEDMQQTITLALFENGLNEAAESQVAVDNFKQEGIEIIDELEKGKRILDDKLKILDLQEKI
jgi:hypothetical protein